jgi:hypothetical protein
VFPANASEFRVVPDQVRELAALLDKIARGEARDLVLEPGDAEQLAQNLTRVVEAQRLIEIGRDQNVSCSHVLVLLCPLQYVISIAAV